MNNEMLQFAVIATLLSLAVLAIMVLPLISRRGRSAMRREAYDINVYKDQLDEVERDLERGQLPPEQAEATRTEIKRRMLAVADGGEAAPERSDRPGKSNWLLVAGLTLFLPLGATLIYLELGSPFLPDLPLAERDLSSEITAAKQRSELSDVVAKLAEKVKANPDDLRGLRLLGHSYVSLQRFKDAADVFKRAYELSDSDPETGSAYAEALTLVANAVVTPKAAEIFRAVIAVDETNTRARYYLAMLKMQQNDLSGAMQDWVDLIAISPEDAPWLPMVVEQFSSAAEESGIDPKSVIPSADAQAIADRLRKAAEEAGPDNADMEAVRNMSEEERNALIRSMVESLAERLRENPGDKEGWVRLERAYRILGETAKADEAASRAGALP